MVLYEKMGNHMMKTTRLKTQQTILVRVNSPRGKKQAKMSMNINPIP
jgi:hypothetical protein